MRNTQPRERTRGEENLSTRG